MQNKMKNYDVIILGAGPAGLSAGIYASRYGLKTLIISRDIGGTANLAHTIENYPGYEGSGFELMKRFFEQAKKHGSEFLNDDIIDIKKDKKVFTITTSSRRFLSVKAVIIALGTQRRKLNIPGEDKFLGKGVSYCATCDGNFFKKKIVAVIGGGESACKAVLLLSDLCKKVYLIHRGEIEKCPAETKKIRSRKNIEVLSKTIPLEIKGKDRVSNLIIDIGGKKLPREKKIKLEGVFIEVGSLPVSDIAKLLKMKVDKDGFIPVNEHMETNVPGVFSAGDVVRSKMKQVVLSAAQGAIAAKSAHEYLQWLGK
jgi:thioredoxin reductase (NADPH)